MYEDSRFIYREYVQNAADQIDIAIEEDILGRKSYGEINITIDKIQNTRGENFKVSKTFANDAGKRFLELIEMYEKVSSNWFRKLYNHIKINFH